MKIDDVLYIIGNGFDIHHGVCSKYSDFANFLKIYNRFLYNQFTEICRIDFLWTEFEKALAYVNRDYFLEMEISLSALFLTMTSKIFLA